MEKTFNIPDIWLEIGKYLKIMDLIRLRQTCKGLYQTVKIYWLPTSLSQRINRKILRTYPDLMIFSCQREEKDRIFGYTGFRYWNNSKRERY